MTLAACILSTMLPRSAMKAAEVRLVPTSLVPSISTQISASRYCLPSGLVKPEVNIWSVLGRL